MYFGLVSFHLGKGAEFEGFPDSVDIWEIVHFILTTLLILTDSSTLWPEGQVLYVRGIFVWCVCVCSCGSVTV